MFELNAKNVENNFFLNMGKIRTIEKIKRYSDSEVETGYRQWIINGCWGKWWINFSKIIKNNLEDLKNYKKEKYFELFDDIERLCAEHDLDYHYKKWFRKSNFIFALNLFRLIKSWTSFLERLMIFFVIYFLLNKYWKKYYK